MSQQQPYAQDPRSTVPATTADAAYAGGPLGAADHRVLESVPDYARAQAIVDQLSDAGFPVEHVRIVGTGLRTVEQVLGRGGGVGRGRGGVGEVDRHVAGGEQRRRVREHGDAGRRRAADAVARGLLDPGAHEAGRAVLTDRGRLLADAVVRDLTD